MSFLQLITPTNLESEKARFMLSSTYNPTFTYMWQSTSVSISQKYDALATAIRLQDTPKIVKEASNIFETCITPHLLSKAYHLTSTSPQRLPTASPDEISKTFTQSFDQLGLNEYKLEFIDKGGFNFRPDYTIKRILASKYMALDYFPIIGEVLHELTHIVRHENGLINNISMTDDYLPTEEGLACYFQDYTYPDSPSLFQHAAEYTVTKICLSASLRDAVDYLIELGFSSDLAWQRASRHKFGFVDTSKPGDIMKPSMYFFHEMKIKKLSPNQKLRLLVGKISTNDLDKYPAYSGRFSESLLRQFFRI